jgi:hypothetical protein
MEQQHQLVDEIPEKASRDEASWSALHSMDSTLAMVLQPQLEPQLSE